MKQFRKTIAILISLFGSLLALYTGGYVLFLLPLLGLYKAFTTGSLTLSLLLRDLIMIFFAATVGGAIWCVFDILAGFFRDHEEEQ